MYDSLVDYIGDDRAPLRLMSPPGGVSGDCAADCFLCVLAERSKTMADPVEYLRRQAAHYVRQPVVTPSMELVICRIAAWCDEFQVPA